MNSYSIPFIFIAFLSPILYPCTAQSSQRYSVPVGVTVQSASVQGVQVSISNVNLQSDYGRNVSQLNFQVTNESQTSFPVLRFAALYFSSDGNALGADVFPGSGLDPGGTQTISLPIARTFMVGERVIVTLAQASTPSSFISVSGRNIQLAASLNHTPIIVQGEVTPGALPSCANRNLALPGAAGPEYLCDPSFCAYCISLARETCTQGVKTYNCTIQTCSCSFTCK